MERALSRQSRRKPSRHCICPTFEREEVDGLGIQLKPPPPVTPGHPTFLVQFTDAQFGGSLTIDPAGRAEPQLLRLGEV
jgi:hypothetical protein